MLMKTNGAHKGSLSPASGGAAEGGGLGLSLLPVGLGGDCGRAPLPLPAAGSPAKPWLSPGEGTKARRAGAGSGEPTEAHQDPRSGQCFQSHAGNH